MATSPQDTDGPFDAVDGILHDLDELYPRLDAEGLPIVGRILRLAQHLSDRRDRQLEAYGLTTADFDVLATLRRRASPDAINVRDLQRSLMLSSGGMTKRLDRMEDAGYIERRRDPNDRRGVLLALTPTGVGLIDDALPSVLAEEAELVRAAVESSETRAQAGDALRRLLLEMDAQGAPT